MGFLLGGENVLELVGGDVAQPRECTKNHSVLHFFFNFYFILLFIYLWLCWVFIAARAFSSCGERGLLFVAVCGLLTAVASHCGAQALGTRASAVAAHRLSSCGTRALERAGFSSCGTRALGRVGFSSCGARA